MATNHSWQSAQQRLASLYTGQTFQEAARRWTSSLSDHLGRLHDQPDSTSVLNWHPPETNQTLASDWLSHAPAAPHRPSDWLDTFESLLRTMLQRGQNLHHPRYVGHQVPASIPIAALFDAVGTVTNQVMAIYEMGPWSTAVERAMIERLGEEIGYAPGSFTGLVTHGGSLANLTCLLTARNIAMPDAWQAGTANDRRPVLVVQEDVHYSITRAAGILGLGTRNLVRVPVDSQRKMDVTALDDILRQLSAEQACVVAVVAGACATPIGAFDPLESISAVCRRYGVWMHVDAAHGGAALMSPRHRHLLRGLSQADSVVWDAHKMLFMPALCAFAFYRNPEHRYVAFQQDAPYLFDPSNPGGAEFDSGIPTLECTKRACAFGLWGSWSLFGRQLFTDLVDYTFGLTQYLYQLLADAEDFRPLHQPECNIQAFQYTPSNAKSLTPDQLGELQLAIRQRIIRSGQAYLVPLRLDGVGALRVTLINPQTTTTDLQSVLQTIRDAGQHELAAFRSQI